MIYEIATSGVIFLTLACSYMFPALVNLWKIWCKFYIPAVFAGIFLTPTYFNLFTIYAMVNLHDISWGNWEGGGAEGKAVI